MFDYIRFTFVLVQLVRVCPVESFLTETALEPRLGRMRPVVPPELVWSDEAGPAVLVRAGEGPGSNVVTKVSLQVVPLREGLPAVLQVTDVTVRFRIFLPYRKWMKII